MRRETTQDTLRATHYATQIAWAEQKQFNARAICLPSIDRSSDRLMYVHSGNTVDARTTFYNYLYRRWRIVGRKLLGLDLSPVFERFQAIY